MISAVATIAYRDVAKFLRDRMRMVASLIFPLVFIGVLGGSLQSNLSAEVGYSLLTFAFIGVVGQNLFQSTASGIISLIADRENDFSREMFVAPVSRYTILFGKIVGESIVAWLMVIGVLALGKIIGAEFTLGQMVQIIPAGILACLLGGAFGIMVMSVFSNQRSANQVFPFVIFPQFFLAGVFSPIKNLPPVLWVLSRMAPMTYAVDLVRGLFYQGKPEYAKVVLHDPWINALVMVVMSAVFLAVGVKMFIKAERER